MKRNSLYAFLALVLVSIACSSSFAEPTPTVTPDPPTSPQHLQKLLPPYRQQRAMPQLPLHSYPLSQQGMYWMK